MVVGFVEFEDIPRWAESIGLFPEMAQAIQRVREREFEGVEGVAWTGIPKGEEWQEEYDIKNNNLVTYTLLEPGKTGSWFDESFVPPREWAKWAVMGIRNKTNTVVSLVSCEGRYLPQN